MLFSDFNFSWVDILPTLYVVFSVDYKLCSQFITTWCYFYASGIKQIYLQLLILLMFILSLLEEKHRVVNLFIVIVLHLNKQNTTNSNNLSSFVSLFEESWWHVNLRKIFQIQFLVSGKYTQICNFSLALLFSSIAKSQFCSNRTAKDTFVDSTIVKLLENIVLMCLSVIFWFKALLPVETKQLYL